MYILMKKLISMALFFMIKTSLYANEQILFERGQTHGLDQVFKQVSAHRSNAPKFIIDEQGFLTYWGDGDFGVLYTKETFQNFLLNVRLVVPSAPFLYVNSGLYFRHKDPQARDLNLPAEIRELVLKRTAGFIADWSSFEVQLLAGEIQGDPVTKQNGAFYDVPEDQQKLSSYRFEAGQTYDIRLKVVDQSFEVFMKWQGQNDFVFVSSLVNTNNQKSSNPGHIGIQSYYSNGREVQAFLFERISITPLP